MKHRYLYNHIINTFSNLDSTLSTVFLIRHADRFSTSNRDEDYKCTITKKGEVDSIDLGAKLFKIGPLNKIFSSPIERCVQTANKIIEGSKSSIKVERLDILEKAYVLNQKIVGEYYKEFGVQGVIKKLFAGDDLTGIRSPEAGSIVLLENILEIIATQNKGISIYVTHDSVLSIFYTTLTGIPVHEKPSELWFAPLDGLCFQYNKKNNEVILLRNSEIHQLNEKLIGLGLKIKTPEIFSLTSYKLILNKANLLIKIADTSIDITKSFIKPTLENSLKVGIDCIQLSALYYGNYGITLPITGIGVLYQIYNGYYEDAIKSTITSVGITLMSTAIYTLSPVLSVILTTGYTGYAGYTMLQNGHDLYYEWQNMEITDNLEHNDL